MAGFCYLRGITLSLSVMSRTPRNFYSARRDVARRCLNTGSTSSGFRLSEEAEALPYQPHESLFDNPSRRHDSVSDENGDEGAGRGYDLDTCLQDESSHFSTSTSATARAPVRAPLQSTTVHNQPFLHTNGVLAMLQHQQQLLQKVLSQQEEMKIQQNLFSQKIAKLAEDFCSSSCSSSPVASRKVKNRVTRDRTVRTVVNVTMKFILCTSLHRTKLHLYMTAWKKALDYMKGNHKGMEVTSVVIGI